MNTGIARSLTLAALATLSTCIAHAQDTVFSDNFSQGSTLNGSSAPVIPPSGPVTSTSYDIAATKNTSTATTIAPGDLKLSLNTPTTSGLVEAQASFYQFPLMLFPGFNINLTYTFTDTGGTLLQGPGCYIFDGLFNSGGNAPVAGALNNSGLNANPGSPYATGNAANWQGYVGRFASSNIGGIGFNQINTRPLQNGSGTTSANQDLLGNGTSTGTYLNPQGATLAEDASTLILTGGSQYTVSLQLTMTTSGILTIDHTMYAGTNTSGTVLATEEATASGANLTALSFDGFAIGLRQNSGTAIDPIMDINQITITDSLNPVPEPNPLALLALGSIAITTTRSLRRSRK